MKQKYALQRQQNLAQQQQQKHAEAQGRVVVHMAVALCAAATERAAAAEHAAPASVAVQLAAKQNARLYPWLVKADYRARVVVEAVPGFLPLVKPEHQRTTPPTDTDTTSTPPSLRRHHCPQHAARSHRQPRDGPGPHIAERGGRRLFRRRSSDCKQSAH